MTKAEQMNSPGAKPGWLQHYRELDKVKKFGQKAKRSAPANQLTTIEFEQVSDS